MARPVYLTNGQEPRDLEGAVDKSFEDFFFIDFLVVVAAFTELKEMERDKIGDKGGDGVEGGRLEIGEAGRERHKSSLNSERTLDMELSTRTVQSSLMVGMIVVTPKAALTAFVSVFWRWSSDLRTQVEICLL